ncbi:MAG: NAD(P)H-dependent oxidoreductase subunit E, partial [Candidatus Latescibacterota bacterium]
MNGERPHWSEKRAREIEDLRRRYPTDHALLLPVLWMAEEDFGCVSAEVMELVAESCRTTPAHVYSLATFYTMFERERKVRYHIQVCHNLSCSLCGAESILEHVEKRLGIRAGETTADGRFRLSAVECLASCGTGPMMQVNDAY